MSREEKRTFRAVWERGRKKEGDDDEKARKKT